MSIITNKYELWIGEYLDLESNITKPKRTIIVTGEQLAIIEEFASTRKDSELNTIYKLNDCEFRIMPHFEFTDIKDRMAEVFTKHDPECPTISDIISK